MMTIRVIDFETTGLEPPAEVVEVGYCDLKSQDDGSWTVCDPTSWLCSVREISPETRAIHHITMRDISDQSAAFDPSGLMKASQHCAAIAAHNLDFETKFLGSFLMPAICTLKAALRVWPEAPNHSNGTLRYWLEDQGLLSLEQEKAFPPHRAGPDAYVTAHLMKALIETGVTGKEMVAWSKEPRLFPTCPIGNEWRGKPWSAVDAGFLGWMLRQPTMEDDLKWNARREIARRQGGQL